VNVNIIILTVCAASLIVAGLYFGLFHVNRVKSVSTRQLFVIILITGFICRGAFLLFTPPFYAPDEQPHFKYVEYLAENHSLPIQTSLTDSSTNDWEYYQPPLYYLLLSPFYVLTEQLFQNNFVTVKVLRAFSIILWGITTLFSFKFLDSLEVHDRFLRVFAVAMVCLLPTYTFLSSVINNDNLLIAFGGVILYLIVQPVSLRNSLLTGILLGLALLTKLTAVIYVALIMLVLFVGLVRRTLDRSAMYHAVLSLGCAMIIWAPWILRNYNIYGSITAEEVANVPRQWETLYQAVWVTLEQMQTSFWAVSGIHNNIGVPYYPMVGMIVFYVACIGPVYGFLLKRKQPALFARKNFGIILALALAMVFNVILVFRFGLLYGQGQGRFLFPLLIPVSLFMGAGLRMLSVFDKESSPIFPASFFVIYSTSFMFHSLAMFMRI
jgi:4-amino-4-deoxy-L-arabinose transferase-like glycosyltransferase